jgi:hypothetical protein
MDILGNVLKRTTSSKPPEPPRYADTEDQPLPEYNNVSTTTVNLTKQDYINLYHILLGYKDSIWESINRGVQSKNTTTIRNDLTDMKMIEHLLEKISFYVPVEFRDAEE